MKKSHVIALSLLICIYIYSVRENNYFNCYFFYREVPTAKGVFMVSSTYVEFPTEAKMYWNMGLELR